jgi:hypothetical protein
MQAAQGPRPRHKSQEPRARGPRPEALHLSGSASPRAPAPATRAAPVPTWIRESASPNKQELVGRGWSWVVVGGGGGGGGAGCRERGRPILFVTRPAAPFAVNRLAAHGAKP